MTGALSFIGLLLVLAGVERNPGPDKKFVFRHQYLLIEVGTGVLRMVFDFIVGSDFKVYLDNNPSQKAKFQHLLSRNILTPVQRQLLPPIENTPSSDKFDITLLTYLLRNACGLCPSTDQVWLNPQQTDIRVEAYITKFKQCRNDLAHKESVLEDETVLTTKWNQLCMILQGLANYCGFPNLQEEIDQAGSIEIDDRLKEKFENAIKDWQREIDEVRSDVSSLSTTVGTLEESKKQHRDKIATLSTRVGNMEECTKQHGDAISDLRSNIRIMSSKKGRLCEGDMADMDKRGRAYQCKHCDENGRVTVNTKQRLEDHIYKYHIPNDKRPFWCKLCLFRSQSKDTLQRHVSTYPRHLGVLKERNIPDSPSYLIEGKNPYIVGEVDMRVLDRESSKMWWAEKRLPVESSSIIEIAAATANIPCNEDGLDLSLADVTSANDNHQEVVLDLSLADQDEVFIATPLLDEPMDLRVVKRNESNQEYIEQGKEEEQGMEKRERVRHSLKRSRNVFESSSSSSSSSSTSSSSGSSSVSSHMQADTKVKLLTDNFGNVVQRVGDILGSQIIANAELIQGLQGSVDRLCKEVKSLRESVSRSCDKCKERRDGGNEVNKEEKGGERYVGTGKNLEAIKEKEVRRSVGQENRVESNRDKGMGWMSRPRCRRQGERRYGKWWKGDRRDGRF